MNRFINAILLFFFIPTLFLALTVGFDFAFSVLGFTGANMPYKEGIFLGIGLVFLIIILRRSIRRWMGIRIVSKSEKFKWSTIVSKERNKRVVTYTLLESMVLFAAGLALIILTRDAWPPASALFIGVLDGFVFTFFGSGKKAYRVGLSSKALIVADREVIILYFTGLRKVSIHQQTVFFDYIKELQLSFPLDCIPDDKRGEFFQILENNVDRNKVYFSKVNT